MTLGLSSGRSEYIRRQKEIHHRRAFGVFPAHYPKEILWAMDILPVEIWDPPLETSRAGAHLQPYICSVVKQGLELILQGKCHDLDGFLFPHTCDSIQNLASIVNDYLDVKKPCHFFYHPKAPYRASSRAYYVEQLRDLIRRIEEQLGPMHPGALEKRVRQGQELNAALRELYELRARGELNSGNQEFYGIVRQGEFLHPDDFLPLLRGFIEQARGVSSSRSSVVLSGVLPSPRDMLPALDQLGVRIGEDDLLSCGRRFLVPSVEARDPFEVMTEAYFGMPPCSTKDSPISERLNAIEAMVARSHAGGVIFSMVKFCEPELFDVSQLVSELRKKEVPVLVFDTEVNEGLSGQTRTRIEAFVEMLG
jgi:benzoyl-CoA reductase/2-hydroxyglutaryl-CoA dehydratase subunit BcrC/BadD/HgdB